MTGQGLVQGRQTQLGFLPENHTDFIFTVIAEELGFIGSMSVLLLILFILYKILIISHNVYSAFAKLVVMGMGITFFLYVLINVGMVMGLFPVVGVHFPCFIWWNRNDNYNGRIRFHTKYVGTP